MVAPTAILTVCGQDVPEQQIPLDPKGAILGRSSDCSVVLDCASVSRHHARIFQDPFGRWIVEDLGSRNGVWVGGRRVEASCLLPGEKFAVGKVLLSLEQEPTRDIGVHSSADSTTTIVEEKLTDAIALEETRDEQPLTHARLRDLNAIADRLAELPSASELYSEVCRCLAGTGNTAAIVLRLPRAPEPLPKSPQALAAHFGRFEAEADVPATRGLRLSRRVLEAVRTKNEPIVGSNAPSTGADIGLTIDDRTTPRTVFCCPLASTEEWMDALYLMVPSVLVDDDTLDFVRAVARQAGLARKSLLLAEEKSERKVIEEQLSWAREIQAKLTPRKVEGVAGVDVAIAYQPAMWVGGDYCDMWALADGRLAFAVGDVSGKGLPAAMVMANLQAALRSTMSFCADLPKVAGHLNRHLIGNLPEGMFVTLFIGLFDPAGGVLEYANAGHIPALKVRPKGGVSVFGKADALPLGAIDGPFGAAREPILSGEGLVIVTDGITEALSPDEAFFGFEGVQQLLEASAASSAEEIVEQVVKAATDFRQHLPQHDDMTVFALVHSGAGAAGA